MATLAAAEDRVTDGQGIRVVAKLAKSFGCPAIPKVLATFATAKCDTDSLAVT